jgi:hypothetical protein
MLSVGCRFGIHERAGWYRDCFVLATSVNQREQWNDLHDDHFNRDVSSHWARHYEHMAGLRSLDAAFG